jgi:haloacetate dehalogenase
LDLLEGAALTVRAGADHHRRMNPTTLGPPDNAGRRDLLKQATVLAFGSVAAGAAAAATPPTGTTRFFPGFTGSKVQTSGATINVIKGGSGPPLLLMHGAPQSHISWRLVAPELAKRFTVIATDLRGYGDSSKPPEGDNHVNYSKRAMAVDQVEVMKHFGYDRFDVIGHDRGGRVGHRMALDHPDKVSKLVVVDIVPTYYLYTHVNIQFVQAYFHWFNLLRPAPGPEEDVKRQTEAQLARATTDVQREYLRTASDPANIHAMCEDYRAGASIDLQHDAADLDKKIQCPLLTLWAERGAMHKIYDVLSTWQPRGVKVSGKPLPGGHTLQEDVPEQFLAEVTAFLS